MTFGNGQTAQYSYDKFDRTTKEQYNNVTYEYAYDASGQLAKQTSTVGEEYNYEYDSLGRLIRSNEYNDGEFEQRTEHIYDASNRLTKQSWYNAGGTTTLSYAYDATTGLLSSLNATVQNLSIPVAYTYHGVNQLCSKAIGSVMTKAYDYCYNKDGGYRASLPDFVNYRDSSGNLIYGDNCDYDSNGRLVKINDSGSLTTTRATYGYDQQGQLTSATVGGTSYTYTYDTAGNIQSKKVGSTTTNYTYGNSAWRDLLTAYGGNTITYSGGNPTKYYDGSTFTWTQGRRLATAKVGSTNISYTYDMAGVRSSKTVGSTKYDFTTLSGLVTRQTGGDKTIDFVYDENNQPLAMKYNGTLYYYVLNAQGDVVRIVNSSRSVVASYTYDPWGKIISSSGTLADINPLRYRGYYYDSETGFYYLQSRYYDPEIGRFINADSYASTDATGLLSTNMFAYCENDPVNRSDPSGEWFLQAAAIGAATDVALYLVGCAISGEEVTWKGVGEHALTGAITGVAFGGASKIVGKVLSKTVGAVKTAKYTTGTPNAVGKMGEQLSGIVKNTTRYTVNNRTRIPDGVTSKFIQEVKNVKTLSYTSQLKDSLQIAQSSGRRLQLFIRPNTKLSGPLKNAITQHNISVRYLW